MGIELKGGGGLVTRASSRIGAAMARELAAAGARVAVNSRRPPAAAQETIFLDGGMTDYPSFAHGG